MALGSGSRRDGSSRSAARMLFIYLYKSSVDPPTKNDAVHPAAKSTSRWGRRGGGSIMLIFMVCTMCSDVYIGEDLGRCLYARLWAIGES